jgi:hypothetical protein
VRNSRSSICSFETLQLRDKRPKDIVATIVFVLLALLTTEFALRLGMAPLGSSWTYWSLAAAAKYEYYQQVALHSAPELVVIGDSTAARDISPEVLKEKLGAKVTAYNLAWPSNYPGALPCTTFPLLSLPYHSPKVVIVSLHANGFTNSPKALRLEANITSSPYCKMKKRAPEEKRIVFLEQLAALAAENNFRLVVVNPPNQTAQPQSLYAARVQEVANKHHFLFLDEGTASYLNEKHFFDAGHLNQEGAKIFSTRLASKIESLVVQP